MRKMLLVATALLAFVPGAAWSAESAEEKNRGLCEWIGVATFVEPAPSKDGRQSKDIGLFHFKRTLKGPPYGRQKLYLRMVKNTESDTSEINDPGENCWSKVPKGSQWILFIPYAVPKNGSFDLLPEPKGRLPYNKQNLDDLWLELKSHDKDYYLRPEDFKLKDGEQ